MAEGLKIQVTADVSQAEKALNNLVTEAKQTGSALSSALPRAIAKTDQALAQLPRSANQANLSLINLGRVVQDAPFGFIGIANNIDPLLQSFQSLRASSGSTRGALKALGSSLLGGGGLALGVSLVTSALVVFGDRLFKTSKAADDAAEKAKKLKDATDGVFANASKEASEAASLVAVLKSETETRERKLAALKELQKIQPEIFSNLKLEAGQVAGLDAAYQKYISSLRTVVAVNLKKLQLDQKFEELLTKEGATLTATEKKYSDLAKGLKDFFAQSVQTQSGYKPLAVQLEKDAKASKEQIDNINTDIQQLIKDITELSAGVDIDIDPNAAQKRIDEIIAKGKRLAEELRKIGFIAPEFNFFDTQAEQLAKARKIIDDFANGLLRIDPEFFKVQFDIVGPPQNEIEQEVDQIQRGIQQGLIKKPAEVSLELSERASQNARIIEEFQQRAKQQGLTLPIPVELDLEGSLSTTSRVLQETFDKLQRRLQTAQFAADAVGRSFENLFSTILSGENPIKAFFQSLGQEVLRLISQLIAAQIRAAILKAILGGTGGAGGIGALLPVGNFGITGFAAGGIVSGPTLALVGEGVGTSRSNPEVIAPLDQLRSILESVVGGRGPGGAVVVTGRIRGNDIQLSNNRTSRRNRRLGSG